MPPVAWLLGWVSFLTDIAGEVIYPLLPVYLTAVLGARPFTLGVIEGVAEATAGLLKLAAGRISDRLRRRRAIVIAGYALSSIVRPLVAVAASWWQVLAVRFADRVGKGVRGAPRDALLAEVAPPGMRGRVFGLQRAMDHAGAMVGPLLASAFLWWRPSDYRLLFLLTIVPGLLATGLVMHVPRDEPRPARSDRDADAATNWRAVPGGVLAVLGVLAVFTLGNSTDAYLLLHLSGSGMPVAAIPLLWSGLHLVKSASSVAGGALTDRFGRPVLLAAGWLVYAAVYAGFAGATSALVLVTLFLVYGLSFGLTEGAEKALLADLAPASLRATVYGLHGLVTSAGSLAASLVCGALWEWLGPPAAFGVGAGLALAAAMSIGPATRRASCDR
jgi:MFS family permease